MDARALSGERPLSAAPRISVLVPAWNEAESIPVLHREIVTALEALGRPWEVIYVDDGSRDGTGDAIGALAAQDPRVRGVSVTGAWYHRETYNPTMSVNGPFTPRRAESL